MKITQITVMITIYQYLVKTCTICLEKQCCTFYFTENISMHYKTSKFPTFPKKNMVYKLHPLYVDTTTKILTRKSVFCKDPVQISLCRNIASKFFSINLNIQSGSKFVTNKKYLKMFL